ncbi:unnamed protein product [Chondrus crispus]|uniref:Uncharacterized protein n=1 Tax=Chondrus crispus TaxID=2769 RepID=R7QD75_CHOCR|nr:unnamed protein product [Chondrus crispus]CDF35396.1 unnamed protein product [Chondrus crispus]|eukprot:XP_005715215.1 unnamed protein product [Chondrus crispus]
MPSRIPSRSPFSANTFAPPSTFASRSTPHCACGMKRVGTPCCSSSASRAPRRKYSSMHSLFLRLDTPRMTNTNCHRQIPPRRPQVPPGGLNRARNCSRCTRATQRLIANCCAHTRIHCSSRHNHTTQSVRVGEITSSHPLCVRGLTLRIPATYQTLNSLCRHSIHSR